jgi:hypothetical protein
MYVYMYMYVTYIQHAHILDIWECRVRKCVCVCDCAGARAPVREPADQPQRTHALPGSACGPPHLGFSPLPGTYPNLVYPPLSGWSPCDPPY